MIFGKRGEQTKKWPKYDIKKKNKKAVETTTEILYSENADEKVL